MAGPKPREDGESGGAHTKIRTLDLSLTKGGMADKYTLNGKHLAVSFSQLHGFSTGER